jgi:hypothetical protein
MVRNLTLVLGSLASHRSCRVDCYLWVTRSLALRAEHNRVSLEKFEGLHHAMGDGFVFLEMRGFQMRLVRSHISVDLKKSDVCGIIL